MEFRWVVLITLWTMLIGPVMDMPLASPKASHPRRVAARHVGRALPGH